MEPPVRILAEQAQILDHGTGGQQWREMAGQRLRDRAGLIGAAGGRSGSGGSGTPPSRRDSPSASSSVALAGGQAFRAAAGDLGLGQRARGTGRVASTTAAASASSAAVVALGRQGQKAVQALQPQPVQHHRRQPRGTARATACVQIAGRIAPSASRNGG